jgi:ABC-2 type transport system ATP-binding protein
MEDAMTTALRTADPSAEATPEVPAVSVRGLAKTYPGGVEAVKGIDFDVEPGEVFGLLGPNGAGKSTTIGMLTTTIRPTSGSAALAGFDVVEQPLAARAVSSVVFQDAVVDRGLSGRRNLEIHARLWNVPAREAVPRIEEIAASLGIAELLERPLRSYSGGQRRRLEIARALISHPRVLFLDEATVGLDPRIRAELLDVIAELRDRFEMTVLLTTHYLDEADHLCDRIAVMHRGSVVACDSPAALRGRFGNEVVELRVDGDAGAALAVLRSERIADSEAFAVGSTVTFPLDGRTAGNAIAQVERLGIPTLSVATRRPTLDDVYLRLTGASIAGGA